MRVTITTTIDQEKYNIAKEKNLKMAMLLDLGFDAYQKQKEDLAVIKDLNSRINIMQDNISKFNNIIQRLNGRIMELENINLETYNAIKDVKKK